VHFDQKLTESSQNQLLVSGCSLPQFAELNTTSLLQRVTMTICFHPKSLELPTLPIVCTRGTEWNAAWRSTQHATSQKIAEGLLAHDASRLSDEPAFET